MSAPTAKATKHIFVTGGVVSSLGKGVAAAAIGRLLAARGLKVTLQKFDPYLNLDPGTMSPLQHGEVFVTDDGTETDLDLGHYERFLDVDMGRANNLTQGRLLWRVLEKERQGAFQGKTVQVVPHVTNEIREAIRAVSHGMDVVITEIGGTIGDIESLPFLEAIRQHALSVGRENVAFVHLTLVPYIAAAGELKTKPTQHTVRELREIGIQPDMLLCRSDRPIGTELRQKIALFTNVSVQAVIEARDVPSIYDIPLVFRAQGVDDQLARRLGLPDVEPDLADWERMVRAVHNPTRGEIRIAVVGKYTDYADSYKSLKEAIEHAAARQDVGVDITWIGAEEFEGERARGAVVGLRDYHGMIVPGGFGERGVEGMVEAIRFARESNLPFLGICLGMQCAVIERARNCAGLKEAHSAELRPDGPHSVITLLQSQGPTDDFGGTLRVGAYPAVLRETSIVARLYGTTEVSERHRHRYEVSGDYREALERAGLSICGTSPDGSLVEFVEDPAHSYFIATQAHPELKSRPTRPHPLFVGLVSAAIQRMEG